MVQLVAVAIALAAACVSYAQVILMRRSAHGDLLRSVGRDLNSREMREGRRLIYSLADKPFAQWTAEERFEAEQVAAELSSVGLLAREGFIGKRGYSYWAHSVVLCYQIVEPLIRQRREVDGIPSHFIYFEWLARKAYQHLELTPWWMKPGMKRLRRRTQGIANAYDVSRMASVTAATGIGGAGKNVIGQPVSTTPRTVTPGVTETEPRGEQQ
jgi:hypothetical protein